MKTPKQKLQKILDQINTPILIADSLANLYLYSEIKLSQFELELIPSEIDGISVIVEQGKLIDSKTTSLFRSLKYGRGY